MVISITASTSYSSKKASVKWSISMGQYTKAPGNQIERTSKEEWCTQNQAIFTSEISLMEKDRDAVAFINLLRTPFTTVNGQMTAVRVKALSLMSVVKLLQESTVLIKWRVSWLIRELSQLLRLNASILLSSSTETSLLKWAAHMNRLRNSCKSQTREVTTKICNRSVPSDKSSDSGLEPHLKKNVELVEEALI